MTPSLDEKEENKKSHLLKVQLCKELENKDCPSCYSPDLDIPLQNISEKYWAIILYWESFPRTGDVVLCAQLSDWQKFHVFQRRVWWFYWQRPFNKFVDKVCEWQWRHKVREDVHLQFDVEQQSWLDNWMEFLNYHHQFHKRLEKKWDELKKRLNDTQKKAEGTGTPGFDCTAEAYQQNLKYAEWKLQQHKTLLQWIEQEQIVMDSRYLTPVKEDNDIQDATPKVVWVAYPCSCQKRWQETSIVLGNVRVLKAKPRNCNKQCQKCTTSIPEPAIKDLAATLQSSIPQVLKCQENKSGHIKEEMQLRQHRPQRVSKAEHFADTNGHKQSPGQALSKHQQSPQQSQSVSMDVIT